MGDNSNASASNVTLAALNDAALDRGTPAFAIGVILCLIGTVGNGLVCFIYISRDRVSNSQWFMIWVATIDVLSASIFLPLELANQANRYEFDNDWQCKSARFLNTWAAMSSSGMLAVIATERFMKVCRPYGWQIKLSVAKYIGAVPIVIGLLSACPAVFIYGKARFEIAEYNLTGTHCYVDVAMSKTVYPLINQAVLFGLFVVVAIYMCTLYCLIGHSILKRAGMISTTPTGTSLSSPTPSTTIASIGTRTEIGTHQNALSMHDITETTSSLMLSTKADSNKKSLTDEEESAKPANMDDENKQDILEDVTDIHVDTDANNIKEMKNNGTSGKDLTPRDQKEERARKNTVLFVAISIAFVLSYTPYMIAMMIGYLDEDYVENMSEDALTVYLCAIGSFYLSVVANPIIYGVCDPRFRKACRELLECCNCPKSSV